MKIAINITAVLLLSAAALGAEQEPLRFTEEAWPAPAFSHHDHAGQQRRLTDYQGTVLVVNFWATWCPPCVKEMPSLQRAWEALRGQGVQVLGINMGDDQATIAGFAERFGIEFPLLLDEAMSSSTSWRLKGLPTTHIVDGDGRVVVTVLGEKEWDDPAILEQLRELSNARAASP